MDAGEQIERFRDFITAHYLQQLHQLVQKGEKSLVLDFTELAKYDIELAEEVLQNPFDVIRSAELALDHFDLPKDCKLDRVRFRNLPDIQKVKIGEIRSIHLDKFIMVEGIVRQASDVRPQVTNAKFECAGCGNTISVLQLEQKFKEPSRCTCGWRGKFRLLSKDLIDVQHLKIEEAPDSLDGGEQPKRISIFLKEDLVEPKMEKKTAPGSRILIFGAVREVPIALKNGSQSTRFDLMVEANNIETVEEDFSEIQMTAEDEEKIRLFAQDKQCFEKLVKAIAPSIWGHEKIKEALVLQLMGGYRKLKADHTVTRGDIHVLLVGDPGSAKSTLLQFISKVAPKARFVSGKGSSGAGLCVAPDSLVLTNPGGIHEIKSIVEENLQDFGKPYTEGVWNSSQPNSNKKIFTLDSEFKVRSKEIHQLWRIDPPEEMIRITSASGKQIMLTPHTKLFDATLQWKEACSFTEGEYLATTRNLEFPQHDKQTLVVDLLRSNPVVLGIKPKVKYLIEEACKKRNITKRELAKLLQISELAIYHSWVNEKAIGNIHLRHLQLLSQYSEIPLEDIIDDSVRYSLYHGHSLHLPKYLTPDLLYFAGLIAGDGDLTESSHGVVIRFSNSSILLISEFKRLSQSLFGAHPYLSSSASEYRPESWRFGSRLVFEILDSLGIPLSPKSHKIDISNILLHLPNSLLAHFLRGYYDTDGSPVERSSGSQSIESSSASKLFSRKLQLVLLRFGIISKLRTRKPSINDKIKGKYDKHSVTITGKDYFERFEKHIGFSHPEKRDKLQRIIGSIGYVHSNLDIIPFARERISELESALGVHLLKDRSDMNGISKKYLSSLLKNVHLEHPQLDALRKLAHSDIYWDKIIRIEREKDHGYKYVYDLTVEDSHNFIVNGILVHNTASVTKDEFLRGWALEAGALALANKGIACVDELDKMSHEDRSTLHEALEQQTITISKANIQATLNAQTSLLAAANPKLGRFDPYTPLASQIDLPSTLINRFDLIFPVRDIPSPELDTKIALHVLEGVHKEETYASEVSQGFLRKYIAYAKQKVKPTLTKAAVQEIKDFYVSLRNSNQGQEGAVKPIPISARQLEGLIRLAEASAKIRLDDKVTKEDARRGIELLKHCLMQVGIDPETGQIDMDRMTTGIGASARGRINLVKDIVHALDAKGLKQIPVDNIYGEAALKQVDERKVDEALEQLNRNGDIFYPKRGFISLVK